MNLVKKLLREALLAENSVKNYERINIYRDSDYIVVRPLNERASCKYGAHTKWCISAPSSGAWDGNNEDTVIIMIIQRNYKMTPERQKLIDIFLQLKELEDNGEMTPELENKMGELFDNNDHHDFEDLSKIALVSSGSHFEIWDANNIPIDGSYPNGWHGLPISNNVKMAIDEYLRTIK